MRNNLDEGDNDEMKLERIKRDSSRIRLPAKKILDSRRKVRAACNSMHFICRKYSKDNSKIVFR